VFTIQLAAERFTDGFTLQYITTVIL